MGKPLKSPPVYFTLVQVRYNELLNLPDYLPTVQERFRKLGYPAFSKNIAYTLHMSLQDGQPVPQPQQREQYTFGNIEQTHSFVLNTDALTFQSTNYGTFEAFSNSFLSGLSLLDGAVGLDFTDRVGLRYLDYIEPKAGESLGDYLVNEALGLGGSLGGTALHSYAETLRAIDDSRLLARVVIQDDGSLFPPDLMPVHLVVDQRFTKSQGQHAILDTDAFFAGRELFSLDELRSRLVGLHAIVSESFKSMTTDYARSVWDK